MVNKKYLLKLLLSIMLVSLTIILIYNIPSNSTGILHLIISHMALPMCLLVVIKLLNIPDYLLFIAFILFLIIIYNIPSSGNHIIKLLRSNIGVLTTIVIIKIGSTKC